MLKTVQDCFQNIAVRGGMVCKANKTSYYFKSFKVAINTGKNPIQKKIIAVR